MNKEEIALKLTQMYINQRDCVFNEEEIMRIYKYYLLNLGDDK